LKVQPYNHGGISDNFASGSNDKNLIIWNTRMKKPQQIYKHTAAVKGIAWHPTKIGFLASGGGT
jgi:WD40 repeat protein